MSDMDEDEDYEFEYSGEEPIDEDDEEIEIQNVYYTSKGNAEESPKKALEGFQRVLEIQGDEKGDWGFKALKQMVKLYVKLGQREEMLKSYRELLTYIKTAVTRNASEKAINSILDYVSSHAQQQDLLQEFYEITLVALQEAKNERLWFKTNLKLGKLMFQSGQYGKLAKILKDLDKSCQKEDGTADNKKGTQLLEVYALEIQMYTATKNHKKLKELYQQSLQIKSAIPHPQIMGVIRECGGKMHMSEKEWSKAQSDFFESFKSYDEAGSPRRIAVLKYLVLANMLMLSEINPFDSVEAKPYKDDPEIVAMTQLVNAYQQNEIKEFESILRTNKKTITEDPFIRDYIEDLLKNIRGQALKSLLRPYTSIKIPFLAKELGVSMPEIESLLVSLILDSQIQGRIDQVNQLLLLEHKRNLDRGRFVAIDKWSSQIRSLHRTVLGKAV